MRPLATLASKVGSGATPRGGRAAYPDHGIPLIRSQNVRFDGFTSEGLAFLTDEQAKQLDGVKVKPGDVLLNITGASIGRVCVAPPEMDGARVNQHVCIIRATDVEPEFLAAYLSSPRIQESIAIGNYGATREALTKAQVLELPVPVPSSGDQRAIATTIRRVGHHRRSAASHVASARRTIERFRQAVLATAYKQALGPEESETTLPLSDILSEPLKNGYSARPVAHETPFRVLTLTATTSGYFDGRHFKYTDETFAPDSPFWLRPGDIVIQRGNTSEYVGVPALYEGGPKTYLYPDLMIRARIREDINPRFVWYMLLAPQARNYLRERATGSAGNMPKINQKILSELPVPVPAAETRTAIVDLLDETLNRASEAESRMKSASMAVDDTSQAILAKAFRGELVQPERSA
jgi:type I restriction enzyme S subunit